MKKLSLIVLVFLSFHCSTPQTPKTDYIEIKHLGVEQKPIKPLFITTNGIDVDIEGYYVKINNQKPELLSSRDSMILAHGDYSVLTIANRTFYKIFAFVDQHPDFFTEDTKKNRRDIDYAIIVNGKAHDVTYKRIKSLSSALTEFLKTENCDKGDITGLSSYLPRH